MKQQLQGKIIQLHEVQESGLIDMDTNGKVFFHKNQLIEPLKYSDLSIGMEVIFHLRESFKGMLAIQVSLPQQSTQKIR